MSAERPTREVAVPGTSYSQKIDTVRNVKQVKIEPSGKPAKMELSDLQKWAVYFLVVVGGWILLIGLGVLAYAAYNHPALPSLAGMTEEQAKEALNNYRQLSDLWRDSLIGFFDVLVTKTALPVVTLLLGYLFGKKE